MRLEIAVVEVEIGRELARRHLLAMRQLVEHARLGEREARVHQALLQQAELARVEARKAPHRGDALFELRVCSWVTCRVGRQVTVSSNCLTESNIGSADRGAQRDQAARARCGAAGRVSGSAASPDARRARRRTLLRMIRPCSRAGQARTGGARRRASPPLRRKTAARLSRRPCRRKRPSPRSRSGPARRPGCRNISQSPRARLGRGLEPGAKRFAETTETGIPRCRRPARSRRAIRHPRRSPRARCPAVAPGTSAASVAPARAPNRGSG